MPETKFNPGDSNQITREYFDSLLIEMRHLDGVLPSTKVEIYGKTFDTPLMMAAFSHMKTLEEIARAAKAANALNWVGMGSEEQLEQLVATGAETVKIIKPYRENERILAKIEHAKKLGVLAVGMDIDHSFNRRGEYDVVVGEEMRPKSVAELREFVQAAGETPFIVKGVLSVTDAVKCAEAGVRGIVVSHHHGIMDYAVPPLMVLPKIAEAVGDAMPIFLDCGIASGSDAFKALALGATAVSVGRALFEPLNADGAEGAAACIRKLTEELAGIMARTGCADTKHIDASLIWKR